MKGGKSKADTKGDNRLAVKKGAPKKTKPTKDPNKPKRPPSAFFVFMEDFRAEFKQNNPNNKSVAAVGKAAGAKWKSLSDSEKAPFIQKAEKRKADYDKNMNAYNKRLVEGPTEEEQEEESDKSKSEVNDEDDESGGDDDEEDD